MAGVGMLHMVAAPISNYTEGSAITYGTGFDVGPAVEANITFNSNDNPDMGDDQVIDNDNGINGYTGTIENNFLEEDVAAKLYGWSGSGTELAPYIITDGQSPEHGFGYIKKYRNHGVLKFRAFWYIRAQFGLGSYANAKTKPRTGVEWQHDVSNITGLGAYEGSDGMQHYVIPMGFDTYSAAEAWLDAKANITRAATT